MARSGPAISAGPIIASSRGGAPLVVKVGGIEGGRPISISPAEARITNIFGPAIKSHNIGFGVPNPRGERSVKSLNVLRSFPVNGENKARPQNLPLTGSNIVPFAESRQAKPVERIQSVRGEIIFFPKIKPLEIRPVPRAVPVPVEYQRLAARIRMAKKLILARQTRVIAGPEISAYAQTGTGSATRQGVAGESRSAGSSLTRLKTEPRILRRAEGSRLVQIATAPDLEKLKRKVVEITAVDKDHKTNQARKEALRIAFNAIQAETGKNQVDGNLLGERSGIEGENYKSEYFYQIGEPKRTDYSQKRTRVHLEKKLVKKGDISRIVEEYTAVRRAKNPIDAPTEKQFEQVVRPPDHIFGDAKDEQVLRKELVYEDLRVAALPDEDKVESLPGASVTSTNEEGKPVLSGTAILPVLDIFAPVRLLSLNPLDSRVDNISDIFDERRVA